MAVYLAPFNILQDWHDDIQQRCQASYFANNPGIAVAVVQVLWDDREHTPVVSRGDMYMYVRQVGWDNGFNITLRECFTALGYGDDKFFQLTMPLDLAFNIENLLDTPVFDLPLCQIAIFDNAEHMMPPVHPVLAHQQAEIFEPIPDWNQPDPIPLPVQ